MRQELPVALRFERRGITGAIPEFPPTVLPAATAELDDGQDPMRVRLFQTTTTRKQVDLGGWWDFASDPAGAGETRG